MIRLNEKEQRQIRYILEDVESHFASREEAKEDTISEQRLVKRVRLLLKRIEWWEA